MCDIYDVVVVGGGPSGSVAARTLAEGASRVLLVERDLKRVKVCGGAIPSKAFEEFDLPRKSIVRKIQTASTISPAGSRIDTSLQGGYLAMVERGEFDRCLREQAEDAGADLTEAEFLGIKKSGNRIKTTVLDRGKEREILSDFVIAADGINSRVSRGLGLDPLPAAYTIQEEIDMKEAGDLEGLESCEFWFGSSHAPNFYSWVFPKKGYIDVGTGSVNGKLLKDLITAFKIRRGVKGQGKQKVYRMPLGWRDSLVKGNILLAGDAAGLVMPFSYEGIYYAMSSGRMAAEAVIRGRPKEYEKSWNRKFRRQFRLMKRLEKFSLKNDRAIERMISIHKRKKLQEISMKLFFEKDLSLSSFLSYSGFFRKILWD